MRDRRGGSEREGGEEEEEKEEEEEEEEEKEKRKKKNQKTERKHTREGPGGITASSLSRLSCYFITPCLCFLFLCLFAAYSLLPRDVSINRSFFLLPLSLFQALCDFACSIWNHSSLCTSQIASSC